MQTYGRLVVLRMDAAREGAPVSAKIKLAFAEQERRQRTDEIRKTFRLV